ncbi:MAG: hypothetical protein P8X42_09310, partial [Calditrichaceae bacterium]
PLKNIPGKVRIILTDALDVSNGYAIADAIVIYAQSSMYMDMVTGTQTWYKQVLKHELAHYMTFIKLKRKLNFLGQISDISVPRWFYEGVAQYYTENWNTYRGDIYIRNAILNGELNYSALNNLQDGKLLYAAAHGFIRFLADQYGDSSLVKLMDHNKNGWLFDFGGAFQEVYQNNPERIFKDFIRHTVIYYGDLLAEYPVSHIPEFLPSYGYSAYQVIPLSLKDSTFIIVARQKEIYRYRTASIVHYKNGKINSTRQISNQISTNIVLNRDKNLAAFGRYYFDIESNQVSLKYLWQIYNLETGKKTAVDKKLRVRDAVFDRDNNLILAEVTADHSTLYRFHLNKKELKSIYTSTLPFGSLACLGDNRLIISAQRKNGYRDLFILDDSLLTALTDDPEDDRRPVIINDSLIIFNRYIDDNPALASINLNTDSLQIILNDQDAYWIEGYDRTTAQIIISAWDTDGQNKFALLPLDSLKLLPVPPDTIAKKERYSTWITKKPEAAVMIDMPDTTITDLKKRHIIFPQWDLIHIFSFGFPLYDSDLGLGLFGFTSWIEALQRQALAGTFAIYQKDFSKSLIVLVHELMANNTLFSTTYYHGPVIFSYQNGEYIEMYQDIGEIGWNKPYFIGGNQRFIFTPEITYSGYYYQLDEPLLNYPGNFGYHGPAIKLNLNYLLPTGLYPYIPKRQLKVSAKYFKSLNQQYDFGISEINLQLATNLLFESLGFQTHLSAIKKYGNIPALKTIGVDRFYEYDFPRDFKYTRPVRGVRKDLSSNELYWSSTEISLYLADRTGLSLLFLPVNNLGINIFLDYAALDNSFRDKVYGYGSEISFGENLYRLAFGQAQGKYRNTLTDKKWYFRLSLYMP